MPQTPDHTPKPAWPAIRPAGLSGFLVTFDATLSEPANRAALAFRNAVEGEKWAAVQETATSLVSTFVRFDPLAGHNAEGDGAAALHDKLAALLASRDWYRAELPRKRRHWQVPTVYGTDLAPRLETVAKAAGMTSKQAVKSLSGARVRVLAIGFAPGQPYLGELPPAFDIQRQKDLTPRVPTGALVLAIRQFVLFASPSPTGWHHVGQTAFKPFRPDHETPFALRPGDEVTFTETTREAYENMKENDPYGGATWGWL